MATVVEVVNSALQTIGTRITVTAIELSNNNTNEAQQINLQLDLTRRQLLRMAPWNFAKKTASLVYITSRPGTLENQSPQTSGWLPGQPAPPWAYEYQYPVDCVRACFVIPSSMMGFYGWRSILSGRVPPIPYEVASDRFVPVVSATVAAGGSGHAVGDIITLPYGLITDLPIGAPAQLLVTGVSSGAITSVDVVSVISDAIVGGSYFSRQSNPVAQDISTGLGTGATFNLTFGASAPQRVVLTDQAAAIMTYMEDVTDPNLMDDAFLDTWQRVLGASVAIPLTGDKLLANGSLSIANASIERARVMDANEGLIINDVTPDWLAVRGGISSNYICNTPPSIDWGGLLPLI